MKNNKLLNQRKMDFLRMIEFIKFCGRKVLLKKNLQVQKGFTLVELLVAMAIFVTFTGIIINSYADIVRSQSETNQYRVVYSDARRIFDFFVSEARAGVLYFDENVSYNNRVSSLIFVAKDGRRVVKFAYEDQGLKVLEWENCGLIKNEYFLNSDRVKIPELNFYVTPAFDPYLVGNSGFNSLQFQPKVTLYAMFAADAERDGGNGYSIDLQTTVSSRFYSAVPAISRTCLPN